MGEIEERLERAIDEEKESPKKILITGTTGYIGKRLLNVLSTRQHLEIHVAVRDVTRFESTNTIKNITIHKVDLLEKSDFDNLPKDLDAAYYLVHSMSGDTKNFEKLETTCAKNFSDWSDSTRLQQIIYLSGIVNDERLSQHLKSRKSVEFILRKSQIPLTVLRSGIIVGSGSASFEIIRDLVEKLPIMIAPKWLKTKSQPIAVRNVIEYLEGVLFEKRCYKKVFDIGGPHILTYKELLYEFARVRKYKRLIITFPFISTRLSSFWLILVTSTSYSLARHLVESMRNEVIIRKKGIQEIIPIRLINYSEAVQRAFTKIEQNLVVSSWRDSLSSSYNVSSLKEGDFNDYIKVPKYGCFFDERIVEIKQDIEHTLDNIWSIGGERGWYFGNFLWKFRGFIDKIIGGVGLKRGRKSPNELVAGDSLDFWRVILSNRSKRRLLLYAEMIVPGEAWLEFNVLEKEGKFYLKQRATFRPRGIAGRLYWWTMIPAHNILFTQMSNRIANVYYPSKHGSTSSKTAYQISKAKENDDA